MYGVTDGNPTPFLQRTYYKALIGHIEVDPTFKWLWKSCCQTKHMAFSWLQIKDRLSSRNMLRRRNMNLDSYNCGLCSLAVEETREHLFLFCPFARQCWGILCLDPLTQASEKLFPCSRSSYNLNFYGGNNSYELGNLNSKE